MAMPMARPRTEHDFLERLVGTWDVTSDMTGDRPWVEVVRSLHGIWYLAEASGAVPGGGQATTVLSLGFDAGKGRYVGTWLGSMMDYLWFYEGEVEPDGRTLSLYTTGPACAGEGMADYREQITLLDDDVRVFRSSIRQPDGSWRPFMQADYRRRAEA